jgi:hypothetical protein
VKGTVSEQTYKKFSMWSHVVEGIRKYNTDMR